MLLFTSFAFYLFLFAVLIVYYLVPKKGQWIVLLVGSMVFYALFSWKFLFFIIATIFTIWGSARLIDFYSEKCKQTLAENKGISLDEKIKIKNKFKKKKKALLVCTIIFNIGILFFLKYANFCISNFTSLLEVCGAKCVTYNIKLDFATWNFILYFPIGWLFG